MKRWLARLILVGPFVGLYILGWFYTPNQVHSDTWGLPWSGAISIVVITFVALFGICLWATRNWR